MRKYANKHKVIFKTITIIILCLFLSNTISWAYPASGADNPMKTLQVQSIFKPIIDVTGKEYASQIRVETALIIASLMREKLMPRQDINAMLDVGYSAAIGKDKKRVLKVVTDPVSLEEGKAVEVEVELFEDFGKGERFKIRSYCKSITDIQKDESKVHVEKITEEEEKQRKIEEVIQKLEKDLKIDMRMKEKIKTFYMQYAEETKRMLKKHPNLIEDKEYIKEAWDTERIADIFYLQEKYNFKIYDLVENGETRWVQEKEKGEEFVFRVDQKDDLKVYKIDPANGKETEIAESTKKRKGFKSNEIFKEYKGRNVGNFVIKIENLILWSRKRITEVEDLIAFDETGKLTDNYEAIAEDVSMDMDGDMIVSYRDLGSIRAGILSIEQAKRIKGLDKHIWGRWSQRKIDRFFRLVDEIETKVLIGANKKFTRVVEKRIEAAINKKGAKKDGEKAAPGQEVWMNLSQEKKGITPEAIRLIEQQEKGKVEKKRRKIIRRKVVEKIIPEEIAEFAIKKKGENKKQQFDAEEDLSSSIEKEYDDKGKHAEKVLYKLGFREIPGRKTYYKDEKRAAVLMQKVSLESIRNRIGILDITNEIINNLWERGPDSTRVNVEALRLLVEAGLISKKEIEKQPDTLKVITYLKNERKKSDKLYGKNGEIIKVLFGIGLMEQDAAEALMGKQEFRDLIKEGSSGEPRDSGPIKSIKIRNDSPVASLRKGLKTGGVIRRDSAEEIKNRVQKGTLVQEEISGINLEDIEKVFAEIYHKPLDVKNFYLYLKILELFKDDSAILVRIDKYLTPELCELSQINDPRTQNIFYEELSQMIKENQSPSQVKQHMEEILQTKITKEVNEASDSTRFLPAQKLGKVLACIFKLGGKIDKATSKAFKLFSLELEPEGDSNTAHGEIIRSCFMSLPELTMQNPPVDPPVYKSQKGQRMKALSNIPGEAAAGILRLLKDAEPYKVLGRTIIYKTNEGYTAFKFLKKEQTLQPNGSYAEKREDSGKLVYESEIFDFLNTLKHEKRALQGDYPTAVKIGGERMFCIKTETVPGALSGTPGIDKTGGFCTFMAYETEDPDYFVYLHEEENDKKAEKAAEKNIHDLFFLAKYGLIHPDIIELFHNITAVPRDDEGKYLGMVDISRPIINRRGTGRLHGWEKEVTYPNMRISGAADFAELVNINDLISLDNGHSKYLRKNLYKMQEEKRVQHILAHFFSNYFLSWVLVEGKRLKQHGKIIKQDWKDADKVKKLGDRAKNIYIKAYKTFINSNGEDLEAIVDWDMLARQMLFYLGGAYKDYDIEDIPANIHGMQGLRISHGDGWGFIHEDIIKEATEKNDKERVLDEYFDNAVSSADREFPEGVLIFKPGFEELLGKEENKQLAGILGKLYKEYAKGWRLDGKHEDLGPINGPFPITELIKANYIYTMAMIGRYAYGSRLEKNPESQDPGVSVRGSGFREIPGRKTEYNDRGQIARLTDDRGIVWEEYFYKEEGVFEAVDLYNPVTGKRIRCEPDKAPQKRPEYAKILIKIEEKNGQFRQVGDMNINADSKALFCVANIQLPETGEEKTRGKGIGKTVLRWIDMQAYRQSKPLEIEQAVNPVMAHIAGTLYEVSRLKITVGDKSYSDIHEEEELRNLLFERTYLLSLPGDFTYLTVGKGSDEVSIERVYNSRTGQLVKDNKLPPGYDYKIDKEKKRLIITDPKGNPARLEYFPGITFVGLPDVGKIVKTQEMENDQRVKGQGSGDRVKGPGFREIPGRKIEYNDRGQIARLTDDRGIVWEEYQYRDDGTIDYVSLHNPVTGRTIKCEYKGYPGGIPGNQKWVISREVEENGPVPIGKLIIQEGQDAATGQRYIRQSNLSIRDKDDRNKGISKTVKIWFALRAYRESKVLKFAAIWSPLSAKIDIGVCDISSLRISKEKSARSGGKLIVFSDGEDLKRQLLEQEFYFQGPTGLVRISVEPGTQEIVTTTNWPKEYTREIKDGELVVNDENGERISIRYEDSFYFEGLPDVKKIVGVQDVEESQGSSPSASLGTRESPAAAGSPLAEKSQSSGSNGPGKTEIERINIEELRELITGIHEYIIRPGSPYALESGLCLSTNVVLYRTIKNIRTIKNEIIKNGGTRGRVAADMPEPKAEICRKQIGAEEHWFLLVDSDFVVDIFPNYTGRRTGLHKTVIVMTKKEAEELNGWYKNAEQSKMNNHTLENIRRMESEMAKTGADIALREWLDTQIDRRMRVEKIKDEKDTAQMMKKTNTVETDPEKVFIGNLKGLMTGFYGTFVGERSIYRAFERGDKGIDLSLLRLFAKISGKVPELNVELCYSDNAETKYWYLLVNSRIIVSMYPPEEFNSEWIVMTEEDAALESKLYDRKNRNKITGTTVFERARKRWDNPAMEEYEPMVDELIEKWLKYRVNNIGSPAKEKESIRNGHSNPRDTSENFRNIGKVYDDNMDIAVTQTSEKEAQLEVTAYNARNQKEETFHLNASIHGPPTKEQKQRITDTAKKEHKSLIATILSLFPDDIPLYILTDPLKEDLFGFASIKNKFIALHRTIKDDPVALFHEIGEYLIRVPSLVSRVSRLQLELDEKNRLTVTINGERQEPVVLSEATLKFIEDEKMEGEWGPNWQTSQHYLLRILQREVFGKADETLTEKIIDGQMTARMEKEGSRAEPWGPIKVNGLSIYAKEVIKPSEIRKTLDIWFDGKEERYFLREQWEKAINAAIKRARPAFLVKIESQEGELMGISYCHKGLFPFEEGEADIYIGDFSEIPGKYRGKGLGEVIMAKGMERMVSAHRDGIDREEIYVGHPAEHDEEEYADKGKRAERFLYQLGFNDICFSWFETLSQEDKAKSRFMGISAYKAQGLVNRVKGMIGGTRKTISKPKQMKLFPQAPEQLKLFPEVSSTSGENIAELEKARKKAVRIKRKLKKKKITDKQLSLFQREKGPENTGLGEDMLKKTLEEQGVDINRVSEFLADFSKNIKEEKKNTFLIQLADCFRESKKTRLGTKLEIMEPYLSDVMDSLQIKMDMANFHFTINHGTTSVGYMAESVNIKNEYHDFTIYLIEEEIDKTYTVNLLVDIDKCLATQPRLADAIMKLCDDRGTTIGIAKQAANNKKGTEGRINGIATRSKDGERQLIVLPLYDVNGEKIGYEKPAGYAYDADVLIDGRRVTRLEAILSHEIAYLFLRRTQKSQKWILKVDQKRIKKFTEKHSEIEWDIKRYEENMEEGLFELVFEIYGMRAERINAEFDFRSLSLEEKETVLKKTFVSAESSFNVHEFFADTLAAYWLVPEFVKEKDRIMFDLFEAIGVWKDIEKGARTDDENNVTDPPGRIGKYYTEIIADDEPGENRWIVKAMRHGASKEAAIDLGRTFRAPPVDDEVKTEIRDAVDSRDASRKTAYKELVKEILEQFPQKTVLYIYKNLYRDLFGFNDVSKKMMALYRELYDDKKTRPVSLFHEICEYLGTLKVIGIRARGDKLFVRIKGRETEVDVRRARKSLKEDGEDWINWTEQEINKPENRHYLLRILQREIFGEKDELLTKKIKDLGERGYRRSAETDTKKAGMATLDQMIRELARDMDITGMENEIKVFYEKYIRLAMRVPVGGQILLSSIRAEHIADMFYLKKAYQFDLFELLEGKRETKWVKRDGAVTDEYVFYNRNDGTYVNKVSEAGKKTFLGKATDGRFGLEDRAHDGGRNIGNFRIKTFSLNKWFQKTEGEMSLNIDRGKDTNDPYALCRYYETIGAHVDWRLLSGSMLITGGLDAGISTKKETERIEGLEKYVRNVWSQRKRDRYFRLTKDIETARLAEANQAFTDAHMDVDIDSLRKIQPEEVAEFIQHYDGATRELEKDMALNDEVKARLGSFCRKYLEIKEEFIRCGYAPEDEYMVKCFNGEIIADMFYLAEKDGFNVLDLRSKNRTKWMKEENGITIHYEFEKEKDRSVSMYEVDQNKPRRKIACFNEFSYYLDDLDADGGKNLGNFLTKTVYFLLWANKKQKKTEFVISFEISGALKEYYMTTGARIGSRTDFGDEIARVDLVGGLRAGILTPQQAKRIKDPNGRHRLNPFIWRVWSQRKLDRYFRLTKAIETEKLVEANRAFTEARAATDIEDLQKIQPEEVAEFIKTYLTEKVKEETDTIVFAHGTTKDAISNLDAGFLKKKLSFQGGRVEDILRLIGTHIEGKLYGDEKEMLIYCLSELLVNTHFRGKETMGTEAYLYVPEKRRDPGVLKFVVSQKGIREERYWGILKKTAAKFSQKGNKGYEYFMDVIQRKKDRTRVGDGSALFWVGRLMERTNVYLEYTRKGEEIITNIWIDLGPLLEGDAHDEQGKETVVFAHGMTEGDINVFKKIEEEKEPVRMPGAGHVINFVRAETGKNIWRSKSYAFGECLGELLNNACMRGNGVVSSHAYVYEAGEHKEYILRFNISQKGLNEEVYWHLLKRTAKNFAQQDKKGPAYLQDTEKREREEITIGGGSGFKFVGRLMEETDVYLEYTRNGENIETDIWVRLEPFLGETFDAGQKETTIRDLAGEMIIKKITKAKIQQVDRKSQELRTRLKNSWAVMPEESRKTPIDIVIDLSLVSKEDLQENIETWAYLFLLLFKQENVNFVFEKGSEILKGVRLSEELANDVAQAPEVEDVLRDLKAAIKKNAKFSDFQLEDEKFDKILDKRVKTVRSEPILLENREKPEKPVEITVTSQECLIWASKNDKLLEENQYPIAMEGFTLNEAGGVPLRNFEAAVMIGFAKALLVLAKRRDIRKKPGEERELPLLKKRLLNQLNGLYSLCIDDIIRFTEDTLDSMVHTSPIVRLNLAIDLALSKITRMPVGGLIELHRAIQSALQAA